MTRFLQNKIEPSEACPEEDRRLFSIASIPVLNMSTVKKESEHSFYPGSKIVYDEPNKAQATGKAQVQKGKVDVSDPAVPEARDGTIYR